MLDCAMDTQNMGIYKKAIELTDWKEKYPTYTDELIEKSKILLQEIATIPVEEYNNEQSVLRARNILKSYGSKKIFSRASFSRDKKRSSLWLGWRKREW